MIYIIKTTNILAEKKLKTQYRMQIMLKNSANLVKQVFPQVTGKCFLKLLESCKLAICRSVLELLRMDTGLMWR